MTILIAVHDSWSILDPAGMGRLLAIAKMLEGVCPTPTPPPPSPAAPPDDDGLAELTAGMTDDTPEPATPAPRPPVGRTEAVKRSRRPAQLRVAETPGTPAPTPTSVGTNGAPTTGRALYAYAKEHNLTRRLLAIGVGFGLPSKVLDWSPSQVAAAFEELAASPTGNGKAH
jgi:hypothetical protein